MKVTIVGAGNMSRGIGARALAGGHEVEIVDRDPAEDRRLAEEFGGPAAALDSDAPFGGEVVVFALYYPGIKDAVKQYGDRLAGKVVVDITNPVDTDTWDRLATAPGSSSAEEVAQLISDGGLRPVDVGPLTRAQQLGFLHSSLQQPRDLGYRSVCSSPSVAAVARRASNWRLPRRPPSSG
jgi:8-hydroxy-5-deazaflavin:NADPH oxidoreductase